LPELIAEAAEPLPELDDSAFGRLFDRFADCRVVLLGEASHGTSEFYRARAAITRRLIEEKNAPKRPKDAETEPQKAQQESAKLTTSSNQGSFSATTILRLTSIRRALKTGILIS